MGRFNYEEEPLRDILFIDVKSFYASVECVQRGLDQSVIFCGQFNTCLSVSLPAPAFALV